MLVPIGLLLKYLALGTAQCLLKMPRLFCTDVLCVLCRAPPNAAAGGGLGIYGHTGIAHHPAQVVSLPGSSLGVASSHETRAQAIMSACMCVCWACVSVACRRSAGFTGVCYAEVSREAN